MQDLILISISKENLRHVVEDAVHRVLDQRQAETHPVTATDPTDRYLTVEEASKMLGLSPSTIRNYRNAGALKPVRFGRAVRYRYADLLELAGRNAANR